MIKKTLLISVFCFFTINAIVVAEDIHGNNPVQTNERPIESGPGIHHTAEVTDGDSLSLITAGVDGLLGWLKQTAGLAVLGEIPPGSGPFGFR